MTKVDADVLGPPQIRLQRGDVKLSPETLLDDKGEISQPYRTRGTLQRLYEAGTITAEMLAAGDRFHGDFIRAGFEGLKAADMGGVIGAGRGGGVPFQLVDARESVWAALQALGGIGSPAGCCAWQVLGRETTIQGWAQAEGWRGRPIHVHTASGILIGALGVLATQYGLTQVASYHNVPHQVR
jgi:hypothetical protein